MKKFSTLFEGALSPSNRFYHITPTSNVNSILERGLLRNSARSTCGTETQKKIYLTDSLENIDDPFPHHYAWNKKDMSIFEVNVERLQGKLEIDPEYDKGNFFMIDKDIRKSNLKLLGRYEFIEEDKSFTAKKYIGV